MSYDTVQAGFATVIKKIAGYDADNVKEDADWRILGHGKTQGAVLFPGPFEQRENTILNSTLVTWQVQIHLFVLYDGEVSTTLVTLTAEREKIIDEVNKWPNLAAVSGVMNAMIRSGDIPGKIENGRVYVQEMTGTALEAKSFTRSE